MMTTEFRLVDATTTVHQAARLTQDGDFGFLSVGEKEHLLGDVTDRDIVVRGLPAGADGNTPVFEMMSKTIIYCFKDDDIREAADLMKREQSRRLAVLNEAKRLVGIVTLGDIARVGYDKGLTGDIEIRVSENA